MTFCAGLPPNRWCCCSQTIETAFWRTMKNYRCLARRWSKKRVGVGQTSGYNKSAKRGQDSKENSNLGYEFCVSYVWRPPWRQQKATQDWCRRRHFLVCTLDVVRLFLYCDKLESVGEHKLRRILREWHGWFLRHGNKNDQVGSQGRVFCSVLLFTTWFRRVQ